MFDRVCKRMKMKFTSDLKSVKKIDNQDEKREKKKELNQLKKSLNKLREDKKRGDHIEYMERLTSDDNDLLSPDKVNSQNVMELIIEENDDQY